MEQAIEKVMTSDDYQKVLPLDQVITFATPWDSPLSNPLTDLDTVRSIAKLKYGRIPKGMRLHPQALNAALRSTEFKVREPHYESQYGSKSDTFARMAEVSEIVITNTPTTFVELFDDEGRVFAVICVLTCITPPKS